MLYTYLDLPKLPSDLEAMCLDFDNLEPNLKWPKSKTLDTISVKYPKKNFAKYKQYLVPKEVIDWLIDNGIVDKNNIIVRIHCMYDGPGVYPHLDYPRTTATNYILTDSTATTCFYRHKTNPNLKPSQSVEIIMPDEIELIDSVVLEHHRWHQLDVTKIHSVENITIPRVALTISDK
jgi:hypothetical protein